MGRKKKRERYERVSRVGSTNDDQLSSRRASLFLYGELDNDLGRSTIYLHVWIYYFLPYMHIYIYYISILIPLPFYYCY